MPLFTIRTHDLTLKVNNLANQLQLQLQIIEQPQVEQLMFTQYEMLITQQNLHIKLLFLLP